MEHLRQRHILLDTNILISSAKYKKYFASFFQELNLNEVQSVTDYGIKFEFLRSSNTKERREAKLKYLDLILGSNRLELFVNAEIFDLAIEIANIYSRKTKGADKQFSFADCLIAAQMMKYQNSLYLATVDNNDFPSYLFDRKLIRTIDVGTNIFNIGIYSFNTASYQRCKEEFL